MPVCIAFVGLVTNNPMIQWVGPAYYHPWKLLWLLSATTAFVFDSTTSLPVKACSLRRPSMLRPIPLLRILSSVWIYCLWLILTSARFEILYTLHTNGKSYVYKFCNLYSLYVYSFPNGIPYSVISTWSWQNLTITLYVFLWLLYPSICF